MVFIKHNFRVNLKEISQWTQTKKYKNSVILQILKPNSDVLQRR